MFLMIRRTSPVPHKQWGRNPKLFGAQEATTVIEAQCLTPPESHSVDYPCSSKGTLMIENVTQEMHQCRRAPAPRYDGAMRVIDQSIMNRLFEVTDEIPLDREGLQVPLVMEGEGKVARLKNGRVEITLPDSDDLGPFLASLPDRLRELG